ncbi:alpha-ketoglutarate dehydrogenase [Bordetella hinzii]|uniref:Pyruvate dehydrogenase E1 component n=2 Tax=Bordetella hinzii TaxID=103855 RepID=A0AAN1VGX4_9BORD|nr:alpha-ketoglutarate dehydrogenase [Bordetella hinzii]AKQ60980.1 Pyruvate dehydrogenase E1 component [Bordetella hinzii]AZW18013.1 alpha-ketoglutarate dehydrogenase [Bordetella hinzii]KCB25433.1 oxoglutarate dehydrogenase (succinyl-transferring) [Bordetella hinzii OH87 BAL007II]KCB39453.1 oxoglutarate dehydrogenase (succinyl-transferring) [Bordetella hinzii 5132]KCB48547.1 oxoglutarate dehydrogenase (succinyl-transferring) [Bordetella hinzii 4161]
MPALPAAIDSDAIETAEWRDALSSLLHADGSERAAYVLHCLLEHADKLGLRLPRRVNTPYLNTIARADEPAFPGDLELEARLACINRWNALAMVVRANQAHGELGGHIASYASAADLFEVGFNHFFRAGSPQQGGDLVYMQPHSAPGIYARAFLEGFLDEEDLALFRQEITARAQGRRGLSSYPHPWLMPDFWQFPTGSMGIGPINAIYQARFMRYLEHRGLAAPSERRVWGIFGDGEMDEPESIAALTLASREKLDNLVFVINCNLQRLDGPVRGNGRIIDELETLYAGAGWNVIKLLWGGDWDALLSADREAALARAFSRTVDGQFQTFAAKDGAYNREHFFGQDPALAALVADLDDDAIDRLRRGGHDMVKIYAAYHRAVRHRGQPTVILAQTKKGFGMGEAGQGRMTTHQQKKLDDQALLAFRDRFALPLSDEDCLGLRFYRPAADSPEMRHLHARRQALGGYIPRRPRGDHPLATPAASEFAPFALQAQGKEMSSTMAVVRMLTQLLKHAELGPRVVPIVADEARTFGMANLFRQIGIYSAQGQLYEPEDIGSVLSYREARDGQILEEGITEAGAISSWTAAGSSYSTHGLPTLPFYIYYSMFGFQRIGDLIWAAADQRCRGFLVGATSGRSTLGGEGLQHQDGASHLIASTVPNCRAYDPAYAYEVAVIVEAGMRRMLAEQRDEFYYLTVTNENLPQPDMPRGAADGILRGMHRVRAPSAPLLRLLGAGPMLPEAEAAAALLQARHGIEAEVWSVTSFSELARDGRRAEREAALGLDGEPAWIQQCLDTALPTVAVSDYVRAVPDQIRAWVPGAYRCLGTDGFGRSDTRQRLRDFFEIGAEWIVLHALDLLAGQDSAWRAARDAQRQRLDIRDSAPWQS